MLLAQGYSSAYAFWIRPREEPLLNGHAMTQPLRLRYVCFGTLRAVSNWRLEEDTQTECQICRIVTTGLGPRSRRANRIRQLALPAPAAIACRQLLCSASRSCARPFAHLLPGTQRR